MFVFIQGEQESQKKESGASFKAMRQIHFENDNSNHSEGESPSSFLSEPSRAVDSSIPKPTVNRPVEFSEDDDGILVVKVVERKQAVISPIESSLKNSFPESSPADSTSPSLTPRLTLSQSSNSASQVKDVSLNISSSSSRNSDSQKHELIECFQTQDLVVRADRNDEPSFSKESSDLDLSASKLQLSVESSFHPSLDIDSSMPSLTVCY